MTTKKTTRKSSSAQDPKTVAIVYRIHTEKAVQCAEELAKWLKSKNHRVLTAPAQKKIAGTTLMTSTESFAQAQLVIVLGGDGTYLRAVRLLEGRQIPILGFNMGSLGFLTVHPHQRMRELVDKTLRGKMVLRPRTMIHATIHRGTKVRGDFHALNDVVLERGSYSQLINAEILVDGQRVSEVKADGFIVSSPTGSTAYNLAAGGPILDPSVRAFTVTPVAPHALTTRPLVFPDDVEIQFRLVAGRDQGCYFVVDGQKQMELSTEDEVRLKKSDFDHLVVREPNFNHFALLKEKLKFGDRA